MARLTITDFDLLTEQMDPTGAIETYLWDEMTQMSYWETIGEMASILETASCDSGSWSGMIYTRDITDRLADPQWVADIDEAIADWKDNTGESPDLPDLASMVTFAVDHTAYKLSCRLRYLGSVAVVVAATDSLDPHPDVIAFPCIDEAEDWVADEIERRVQYHFADLSPYSITDEERDSMIEIESTLFTIKHERL